jgi:hypothetical protein
MAAGPIAIAIHRSGNTDGAYIKIKNSKERNRKKEKKRKGKR